jgi:uridylate kinase
MKHNNSLKPSTLVISVGGSLVVPKTGIDYKFLKDFKKLIQKHIKNNWRFVIVVGGGTTARNYQTAAKKVGEINREDMDWIGIHSTRLNGHLMRTIFRKEAHSVMIKDPSKNIKWNKPVLVAAGWKPGWSTDYVATTLAKKLKADVVVNLSNIDYVYDKDPNKYQGAKVICDISWKEFRKMVGNKWDPGMNVPFDPVASKLAHKESMKVALLNGKNIKNLDNLLNGKNFVGTIIGV